MELMPLANLIFYSIPESIILISLSSTLYGYDVRSNFKRIFLLSVCLALTTYVVRALPIKMGVNIIIQIPIFILLTTYLLKVTFKRSTFIILTGYIIIALTESIVDPIIVHITGISLKILFGNIWSRLATGWCLLLVLLIPTVIIIKKRISLASAKYFIKNTTLNIKITLMILLVLLQALLAGLLQATSVWGKFEIWPVAISAACLQKMIGISLIAIPIISIFFLKRLFVLSEQEAATVAQEAYLDNVNDLLAAVQGQRHDFVNHIQVLHGLMQMKMYKETADYLNQLVQEAQQVKEILGVDNLAVTALLRSKQAISDAMKVTLKTEVNCSLKNLRIASFHLVKILGNLLDNAIDAAVQQTEEFRWVSLRIFRENSFIVFQVVNPRPVIPKVVIQHIFDPGFTTKTGDHAGQGLFIVKKLVKQNGGSIDVSSSETEGTVFTVKFPCQNQ